MKIAAIFPGQGSQSIGMGKDLYENFSEAKEVFQEIDDALNQNLSNLMFHGDIEELTMTENTQPALMAVSMALVAILEKQGKKKIEDFANYVFGHSLGEYTALTAVGSFSVSNSAKLLRTRGKAMQEAAPKNTSSMVAILGCSIEEVEEIVASAKENDVCQVANDNADGQIVVSGHIAAMERVMKIAASKSKRAIKLPVSAAFHSELMLPAEKVMAEALSKEDIKTPKVPLIANISADIVTDPNEIRKSLVAQVSGRVRFRESVIKARELGVGKIYEIGAGKVLSGLVKRIDSSIETKSVQNAKDLEDMLTQL